MQSFGVQKIALKKRALQPELPTLLTNESVEGKAVVITWLGSALKNVEGLGERSAYGLPDETGVIITSVAANSLLSKAGLQPKDVIRVANNTVSYTHLVVYKRQVDSLRETR